jgi:hypothetical protein
LAVTTRRVGRRCRTADRGDFLPGFEASLLYGLGAPKNTPAEIIDKLNKEINAGLAEPKIKARLADLDGTALMARPPTFAKTHRRRNREVGKGDPGGRHQAAIDRSSQRQYSETSITRMHQREDRCGSALR